MPRLRTVQRGPANGGVRPAAAMPGLFSASTTVADSTSAGWWRAASGCGGGTDPSACWRLRVLRATPAVGGGGLERDRLGFIDLRLAVTHQKSRSCLTNASFC